MIFLNMYLLDRISSGLNRGLMFFAGMFFIAMIVVAFLNIIMRLFKIPFFGAYELIGFFGAVAFSFSLGYTVLRRDHVAVDILVNSFSKKTQKILHCINSIICMGFSFLIAWQTLKLALIIQKSGEITETLRMSYHGFVLSVAAGFFVAFVAFLVEFIRSLFAEKGGEK